MREVVRWGYSEIAARGGWSNIWRQGNEGLMELM